MQQAFSLLVTITEAGHGFFNRTIVMGSEATVIKITRKKLAGLYKDSQSSAGVANLVYVSDTQPGITRHATGLSVLYKLGNKTIKDKATLGRIRSLVLPPAWKNVWICTDPMGHLQATGYDTKNRKQYKYHPLWNTLRNQTKFHHLYDFGKALPQIRERLQKDISLQGLPLNKVLATIVSLMQCTCIRIGSSIYEKLYGSFGLTTLKDKHVSFDGNTVKFTFKGKKGVLHDISLKSRRLAQIVRQCRDIPGKELFQYLDDQGQRHSIDSGMVNNYIKDISGGVFTAKDFRTWAGSLHAIEAFKELGPGVTESAMKKNVVAALDKVAEKLGNTRTVCKKYYVHPMVIDHYLNHTIDKYLKVSAVANCGDNTQLSEGELVLMDMLKDNKVMVIAA